jgi:hypothetical protein
MLATCFLCSAPTQNRVSEPTKHRNSKRGTNLVQVSTPKIPPIAHTDFHIMPQSLRLRMTTVRTHDRIARPALLYQVIYNVLYSLASLPTLCLSGIQQVEPSPVTRKVHRSKSLDTGEAVSNRLHFGLCIYIAPRVVSVPQPGNPQRFGDLNYHACTSINIATQIYRTREQTRAILSLSSNSTS